MKAVVAAFNQEKALVGAFSVITNLRMQLFEALMSGAYSKPMPWSGGGSTKPPVANNYLDSHGLNPGLGNAGHASFPSVVTAAPSQAARMANYTR